MIQQTLDLIPKTTTSETYVYTPPSNPFIWEKPKSLTKTFCKKVIRKFLKDDDKYQGIIGEGRVDKKIKDSLDLPISQSEQWEDEDEVFFKALTESVNQYEEVITDRINLTAFERQGHQQIAVHPHTTNENIDTGYQVQETQPGSYYDRHQDYDMICQDGMNRLMARKFTYLWYLNEDFDEGETEFFDGSAVKPETGKLIIFPATWNFYHRGRPPVNGKKYICTGWMYDSLTPANHMNRLGTQAT